MFGASEQGCFQRVIGNTGQKLHFIDSDITFLLKKQRLRSFMMLDL